MRRGDKINLKNGTVGTVTKIGTGDFIGDAYPIYYTAVENKTAVTGFVMSDELKPTDTITAGNILSPTDAYEQGQQDATAIREKSMDKDKTRMKG